MAKHWFYRLPTRRYTTTPGCRLLGPSGRQAACSWSPRILVEKNLFFPAKGPYSQKFGPNIQNNFKNNKYLFK